MKQSRLIINNGSSAKEIGSMPTFSSEITSLLKINQDLGYTLKGKELSALIIAA
jgi:hypothetical protein